MEVTRPHQRSNEAFSGGGVGGGGRVWGRREWRDGAVGGGDVTHETQGWDTMNHPPHIATAGCRAVDWRNTNENTNEERSGNKFGPLIRVSF